MRRIRNINGTGKVSRARNSKENLFMLLTSNIKITWAVTPNSVLTRAWNRFLRDIKMTLNQSDLQPECRIQVGLSSLLPAESYRIDVSGQSLSVRGGDALGIIYALLHISERYLGITPFWFWNDTTFQRRDSVSIPEETYGSPEYPVRFRGWFINDEVLLDAWGKDVQKGDITENFAFEMAMEACLRLGGNMVIPGTDHNSHKYFALAADMGLWVTHHHAEPLGAQMFARAYPRLTPSYRQYPELFEGLWRAAIERQKDHKIIWNIGFRGQGDRPFWADDPEYDTPEKRGALIGRLIRRQYDILCEYIENPMCCTNLYGEVMELYQQGLLSLPENVIHIWADNGYGKMVSRRQGRHNPRIPALPPTPAGLHGVYYHASFYDLQAASHITLLPNGTDFVERELRNAMERGVRSYLLVNCSNVRPHAYMLDHIAHIWGKTAPAYAECYFPHCAPQAEALFQNYAPSTLRYGPNEDDRAGEQFCHYTMRALCHGWLLGKFDSPEPDLEWLTGPIVLDAQVDALRQLLLPALDRMKSHYNACRELAESFAHNPDTCGYTAEAQLLRDSLLLQAAIHYKSMEAELLVCDSYRLFREGQAEAAFVGIGDAVALLGEVTDRMALADHGIWQGFYDNDCLTDVKFTAYTLERVMGYIRNLADGPHFYGWMSRYMSPEADSRVVLITNMHNHPGDRELYLAMRQSQSVTPQQAECVL